MRAHLWPHEPCTIIRSLTYLSTVICRECASHFDTMVNEDLDDSVQSYDDVILWLWKAHNKVNQRLKGEGRLSI